ncbi:MAG: hypothetical protein EHM19_10680 [Candidatus Latescibacterota bacterium]|nr:MAG: hypothetical protein EHM19_10680 [Candidatus Latescibacterota bacterium]
MGTARRLIEAFPRDTAPKYLIRDRDKIFGVEFRRAVSKLGLDKDRPEPRSVEPPESSLRGASFAEGVY